MLTDRQDLKLKPRKTTFNQITNELNQCKIKLIMFRTFIAYFKIGFKRALYYRGNFILGIVGRVIVLFFMITLWTKVFQDRSLVGGMNYSQILTYYIFAFITGYLVRIGSAKDIARKIKDDKHEKTDTNCFSVFGAVN